MSARSSIRRVVNRRARYALIQGDCLKVMAEVPDGVVDLILCDLPYGITDCAWDKRLPFEVLWWHYGRIIRPAGAVVLTGSQPFTTRLAASKIKWLKCEWIWDKVNRVTGFLNAKRVPLKAHENVLVFYRRAPTYNPQMTRGKPYRSKRGAVWEGLHSKVKDSVRVNTGTRYPTTILRIPVANHKERGLHPTQKPVALMEYFVRTYTNPGDLVLDNCMGSGTTGVACLRTGRRFIGIELAPKYLATARWRLRSEARRTATALPPRDAKPA